jgi:hypothetical protein
MTDLIPTTVNGLRLRREFGRDDWDVPKRWGPDGWSMVKQDRTSSVIVSAWTEDDGVEWIHASIACEERTPGYDELKTLHRAVFGDRWAYQVFAPDDDHVNIHPHALHLWGRVDGVPAMPNFGAQGTI